MKKTKGSDSKDELLMTKPLGLTKNPSKVEGNALKMRGSAAVIGSVSPRGAPVRYERLIALGFRGCDARGGWLALRDISDLKMV
jgi:hypothetical protein